MSTQVIETEELPNAPASWLRSRLMQRIGTALTAGYEARYDVLPSLEFESATGRFKPDLALLPPQTYDWRRDVLRCPTPPLTTIDIVSPAQSFEALVAKIRQQYFPGGAQSAWVVVPVEHSIHLFRPEQAATIVAGGLLNDPTTGVILDIDQLFR